MLQELASALLRHWPVAVAGVTLLWLVKNFFNRGLNQFPGPILASLTDWWRFFDVWGRRPDITHRKLHDKYGDFVRLGPNCLSVADPRALKTIYGLNKGFIKVCYQNAGTSNLPVLTHRSPNSTPFSKLFLKVIVYRRSFLPPMSNTMHSFGGVSTTPFLCPPWYSTSRRSPS